MTFTYTPYSGMSPDDVTQARGRGQMMTRAGMDTNNLTHWTQALGKVLQSGVGAAWGDVANQGEREGRSSANMLLAQALQGKPEDVKGNIGAMLANPWASDQGGALAGRFLQHQLDQSSPDAALRRQQIELGNRQLQEQIESRKQMFPLEQERLRLQVEEQRQKADDPMRQFMRGIFQPPASPQGPTAAMPVPPAQGLQPQSAPMPPEGAPNLIQTQAGGQPSPQPAPQPQPGMVQIPGFPRPMTREQAEAMKIYALTQKNEGLAKHIDSALGTGLETGARTELDKTLINLTNQAGRLDTIGKQFDASFLQAGTQIDNWFKAATEKAGGTLTPTAQAQLAQFNQFRSASIGHFNRMLKELSGTAVSAQEFERIKAELPNPGTGMLNGVFDGDSPTQFAAKWKAAQTLVKSSIARAHFLRNNKFSGDVDAMSMAMPLEQVPSIINKRGGLLEQQFRQANPQASPEEIGTAVRQRLRQEFGI